jgi:hypothetical protein
LTLKAPDDCLVDPEQRAVEAAVQPQHGHEGARLAELLALGRGGLALT